MGLILKGIRSGLGFIILTLDRLTAPRPPVRTPEEQRTLDGRTASLALYELNACPFCVKVRREVLRRGLMIKKFDVGVDSQAAKVLLEGGKQDQVPCLRISGKNGDEWLYESSAINEYLAKNFPIPSAN